ncbi:MAG: MoaD/ThiS family protein [Deltaproteobacteria bacterium]|nr:MoaD/ThiS family protein [Deltaproteobacteria bacterium]
MPVTVRVPTLLKVWFDGQHEIQTQGQTIGECLDNLDNHFPGIKPRLKTVVIFLNGNDVRTLRGMATPVRDNDEIVIYPLLAGG